MAGFLSGISSQYATRALRRIFSPAGTVLVDVPLDLVPVVELDPAAEPPFHTKQPWGLFNSFTANGVDNFAMGIANPANSGVYVVIRRFGITCSVTTRIQLLNQWPSIVGGTVVANDNISLSGIDGTALAAPTLAIAIRSLNIGVGASGAPHFQQSVIAAASLVDIVHLRFPVPPGFAAFLTQQNADIGLAPVVNFYMQGDLYTPAPVG